MSCRVSGTGNRHPRGSSFAGGTDSARNAAIDRPTETKLQDFITKYKLRPSAIARVAGCSRQHLLRLRKGEMDPTRGMMAAILRA